MTFLPSVIRAEYRDGFRIHLTFNDNSEKTIDFRPWLEGPIFEPLKDPNYFRRFFLEGGTVVWPNGADIAPETLYEAGVRQKQPAKRLHSAKVGARAGKSSLSRKRSPAPAHARAKRNRFHRRGWQRRGPRHSDIRFPSALGNIKVVRTCHVASFVFTSMPN